MLAYLEPINYRGANSQALCVTHTHNRFTTTSVAAGQLTAIMWVLEMTVMCKKSSSYCKLLHMQLFMHADAHRQTSPARLLVKYCLFTQCCGLHMEIIMFWIYSSLNYYKIMLWPLGCCSFVLYQCPCLHRPNSVCATVRNIICHLQGQRGFPVSDTVIFGLWTEKFGSPCSKQWLYINTQSILRGLMEKKQTYIQT